jgi:hypothetical protein
MGKRPAGTPQKKPPAPSEPKRRPATYLQAQIVSEIYTLMERLDADEELLAIIGSWRDTPDDAAVHSMLREYRAGRMLLHRPQ